MGQRNSGVSRRCDRRGHAGNDLERNAVGAQGLGLFAAAAEDERVAAFQTHDVVALPGPLHQQAVDLGLTPSSVAADLADVDQLGLLHGVA